MKNTIRVLLALAFFVPGLIFADIVSFRVGYFVPRANSDLWNIEFENMSFTKSNFQNSNFSFSYEYFVTNNIGIQINVESFQKRKLGYYRDWVGYSDQDGEWAYPVDYQGDFDPSHTFSVATTPLQLSIKITPLGRKGAFIPFIGGGVGVYLWNVRMEGDMIDFADEWYDPVEDVDVYPIYYTDARQDSKFAFGYHVLGGAMVPIGNRISVEGEFKYNIVKGTFSDDEYSGFEGFEPFDLSGYQISIGINYWF